MTPEKMAELFERYDSLVREIARIEILAQGLKSYPSEVLDDLIKLDMLKWQARRAINSAFAEQETQKPLWRRIFKK